MIAKGSGYVRGNREAARARLGSHMKYTEHRSMSERETRDDRRIYSKDEDVVSRKDAVNDVMEHTSTSVNYHKMVLSPGQGEPIRDWREWTRDVMRDLEVRQGRELHWYAVNHNNTDNPHVHVVLAGAGENLETSKTEPVKMYAQDYQMLRESGREHSDYEHYHRIEELVKEYDAQDGEQSQERDRSKEMSRSKNLDRGF
jgi:type IV secretory pathway VirD2 relaxase